MDPEVLSEAKDFVSGWIDKAGADGSGVNYEVSSYKLLIILAGLQGSQGLNGPLVRSFLALRHGGGLLVRGDPAGQVHPLHVLRWQDRRSPLQVLSD